MKLCNTAGMLNWLVIGIGDITRKRVIPAIQTEPRSRLYALLTRDPGKAANFVGVRAFNKLEEALADPKVDAVYVASPVALHAEQTIASLRAGKHVLCEKPVAMNYAQAVAMAEAAEVAQRLLGVSYYRRFYPKVQRARELIAQRSIGKPTFAFACYHGWLENPDRGWLKDPALAGGGPFYDVASHRLDMCNFLFGTPQRATGILSNALHELPVEDSGTAIIQYSGGLHAVVDARWNSSIQRDEVRVIGTEGELDLTPLNGPSLRVISADGSVREEEHPAHTNVHSPLIENFVSAVAAGETLMSPIRDAIQTDWITEQVFRPGNSVLVNSLGKGTAR